MIKFLADRRSKVLFFLMFSIVCLLNVNYNILRSARNALVVADLGHGAGSIPIFELCGTMPCAVLMVWILTKLLNRFSMQKVFILSLTTFSAFFLVFAVVIYPYLSGWLAGPFSMLFFVMAELWKIALLTVLFWGLVNHYIPLEDAKRYYAPLMLGGSAGTILAGPIVSMCTSHFIPTWSQSLTWMMVSLSFIGILTMWLFTKLWKEFAGPKREIVEEKKEQLSVWESIQICVRSKYLSLLAWITIADYVAYALGEVIFLDVLKQKYPDPRDYCDYMGHLSLWSGIMTAFSALVITPFLLKRCRWVIASLVTPVCILITEGAFFIALWNNIPGQLEILIFLGTAFFCLVRAAKYTLFDTSKELSFILLPSLEKMQGKLVIDGMCSRVGRGSASMLSIVLIQLCGGVLASASIVGFMVLAIAGSCVLATFKLGTLVDKKSTKLPQS